MKVLAVALWGAAILALASTVYAAETKVTTPPLCAANMIVEAYVYLLT